MTTPAPLVRAKFREPWPPHTIIAEVVPASVGYGFVFDRASTAAIQISQEEAAAIARPDVFDAGALVTLERDDGLFPWAGFVDQVDDELGAPTVSFTLKDWAGALFDAGRTAKAWALMPEMRAGQIAQLVLAEANGRAEPPLMVDIPSTLEGDVLAFQPKAESITDFLRTMSSAGLEWKLRPTILANDVRMSLVLSSRIGSDRTDKVIFDEAEGDGGCFVDAKLTRSLEGNFAAVLAIGGGGPLADRPAVQVNAAGRSDEAVSGFASGLAAPASPALAGTRVVIEDQVSNEAGLLAIARRQYRSPEYIKKRMTLSLFEGALSAAGYLDKIDIGSSYGVRFKQLRFRLGFEATVRCVALDLDASGVIRMTAEVQSAQEVAA